MYSIVKRIYENINTVLFISIDLVVVLKIITRFIPSIATPWTEDVARCLLVLNTVLGVAIVSRKGEHLGAFFLRDAAKGRLKGFLFLIGTTFTFLFLVAIAVGSWKMTVSLITTPAYTTIAWIPRGLLFGALFCGLVIMAVYALRDMRDSFNAMLGKREITRKGTSSPFPEED